MNRKLLFFVYLDDNDDDYYDDGWIDGVAMDDAHLVDSQCDNQRFENDELVLPSTYSFSVDDKNRIQCPIAMLPHCVS